MSTWKFKCFIIHITYFAIWSLFLSESWQIVMMREIHTKSHFSRYSWNKGLTLKISERKDFSKFLVLINFLSGWIFDKFSSELILAWKRTISSYNVLRDCIGRMHPRLENCFNVNLEEAYIKNTEHLSVVHIEKIVNEFNIYVIFIDYPLKSFRFRAMWF